MLRQFVVRWATWLAGVIAASIPIVDTFDMYTDVWWVDVFDGAYTIAACAALVWLVSIVKRFNQKE